MWSQGTVMAESVRPTRLHLRYPRSCGDRPVERSTSRSHEITHSDQAVIKPVCTSVPLGDLTIDHAYTGSGITMQPVVCFFDRCGQDSTIATQARWGRRTGGLADGMITVSTFSVGADKLNTVTLQKTFRMISDREDYHSLSIQNLHDKGSFSH